MEIFLTCLFIYIVVVLTYDKFKRRKRRVSRSQPTEAVPVKPAIPPRKPAIPSPYFRTERIPFIKEEYMSSAAWRVRRQKVLKRDNHPCQACGYYDIPLDVHHLTYKRYTNEPLSDLVALCRDCHDIQHLNYGYSYNTDYYPIIKD